MLVWHSPPLIINTPEPLKHTAFLMKELVILGTVFSARGLEVFIVGGRDFTGPKNCFFTIKQHVN